MLQRMQRAVRVSRTLCAHHELLGQVLLPPAVAVRRCPRLKLEQVILEHLHARVEQSESCHVKGPAKGGATTTSQPHHCPSVPQLLVGTGLWNPLGLLDLRTMPNVSGDARD